MAVAGLLFASRAHAADLPNGAAFSFLRLFIYEDGNFQVASTPDALRHYLNIAHCECAQESAGMEQTIKWELKLSVQTGTHKPGELWVGNNCDDPVLRMTQCKKVGDITDIDQLAITPTFYEFSLSDLINGPNASGTCMGISTATVWVLVDTDGNGDLDFSFSQAVGNGADVTAADTTAPPQVEQATAASAENGVKVSWKLPTAAQTDLFYYQALCADPDGQPVKPGDISAHYYTARTVCGGTPDPTLTATDIDTGDEGSTVTLPVELTQLNPDYICGEASGKTDTSMLIDGLANGTAYTVVLLSIDQYGNPTGQYFTSTITPHPVTDFWEDLHDRGSNVEGGFCLLAETYGENGPITNLLRAFRDDNLGGDGPLTRLYYATLGKLGALVHGSLALRILAAIVLFPLVVIALAWHFLTLPGLLALIALALWARKKKLRIRRLAPALAALAVFAVPAAAHAQPSPYWDANDASSNDESPPDDGTDVTWHAGIRVGPYTPNIDKQFGMDPGPYHEMFGGARYTPMLDVDRILWHGFGQLGVGISLGYMQKTAHAWADGSVPGDPDRMRSAGDTNTFHLLPIALSATYRFTWLDDEYGIPVVPYVRGGLGYYVWWIRQNGKTATACWDGTHTDGCDADKAYGASLGFVGSIGLSIRAERVDPAAATSMRQGGLQHAGFYGELSLAKVDGFGSETKLSVGDTTWFAGVDFEF